MAFLTRRRFLAGIGMALTSLLVVIGSQFVNLSPAVSETTLVVYAAVSLTEAVNEIEAQYQSANPDAHITFVNTFDSSGILLNKIQQGDPVDVFISAATDQVDQLQNEEKLLPDSRRNVVTNQLVLVTPTTDPSPASDAINTFNDFTDPSVAGISIGNPVQAATVTYDFTIDLTTGSLANTESFGFFSYDDSTLTGIGLETLGVNKGLSVSFDFLGKTYYETDENSFPDFPIVQFQDRSLLGIAFLVQEQTGFAFGISTSNPDPNVFAGNQFIYGYRPGIDGGGVVKYSLRSVFEPSAMSGLAVLGFGLLLKRKVIAKHNQHSVYPRS